MRGRGCHNWQKREKVAGFEIENLKIGDGTKSLDWLRLAKCGAQVGFLSLSNEVSTVYNYNTTTHKSSSNTS